MRVLVVHPGADCSVSDVHDGIVHGLRANGVHAESLNTNDRLYFYAHAHIPGPDGELKPAFNSLEAVHLTSAWIEREAYRFWPDVIVFVSGFFIDPGTVEFLRHRPHHLVLWCTEAPYEDDKQLAVAPGFHTVIVNDPVTLAKYREVNPRTWYLPHSYDPKIHRPGRSHKDWLSDFFFCGTGFPSRVGFLEKVDFSGIDVLLGGNWQIVEDSPVRQWARNPHKRAWMLNRETVRCYRSTKTSVNLYRTENTSGFDDGWAMGPREVELAACGTWFARQPRAEGDEMFPMLPTFTEPAELGDLLRWALAHPDLRQEAASAARAAISARTFRQTMSSFLDLLSDVER